MSQTTKGFAKGAISIKAIIIVIAVTIGYQLYIGDPGFDEDQVSFAYFSYGISCLAVGIAAFFVAKRYRGSPVFGKTYFALAIGFTLLFVGDLIYNYYDIVLGEDPYPSIADVFFIAFYAFAGYHIVKNVQYFKKDLGWNAKIGVVVIAAVMVAIYGIMTIGTFYDDPVSYSLSMAYVLSSAAVLALALLGAVVFRHSVLGIAWGILVAGIFLYSVADVWYYYLEEIEEYTLSNPVNTLWILSNAIMVYALYKHKKTI